jgi:arylsulfatase A-like enzyme/Flp pilus assembly protein TadD
MKWKLLLSCVLTVGFSGGLAAQSNIVLVTLDTTRADRMGFLGSKKGLTPNLDALAGESVVFTRAYAQAPLTTASHATLLTGTYPLVHGVEGFSVALPRGVPTLPELLRQRGYRTGAFVGALILDPVNGLAPGFDRGFEVYDAGFRQNGLGEDRYQTLERRAPEVVGRATTWLRSFAGRPFFLWVHVFDPHEPYDAPPSFRAKHPDAYDAEIAYVDSALGRLFAELKSLQRWNNTLVAVMADHGEAFGEHGERAHGVFLYDSTIHVPLAMKFPQGRHAGKRATGRVGLVDVAPTVLEVAGVPVPREMNGQSLAHMAAGNLNREAPAYSATRYPADTFGWSALAALRSDKYLLIRAPRSELYDLTADPQCKNDLAASSRAVAERLTQQLENFEKFYAAAATPRAEAPVDPRLAEKLAALGYAAPGVRAPALTGADPKDKIAVANQMQAAILLNEGHAYESMIPLLQGIVASDPQIFSAQMMLGGAYFEVGRARESIPHLRKATEQQPDSAQAHYALGRSLMVTGNFGGAVGHLEIATAQLPKWPLAHFLLGSTYAAMRQPGKAVQSLRQAAQLDPGHFEAHLILGRILAVEGQPGEGLPFLERAALLRPTAREAFRALGDCYEQLGRAAEAASARAKAASLPTRRPTGR